MGAMELLPDAAGEAQSLQLLHRFGWPIGKRVKRMCGNAKLGDRNASALECEPPEPSHRGTLIAIGIAVSQHQADAQRVVKGYLWKLTRRGENEVRVSRLERAPEANVWTAGVTHYERMFAPRSSYSPCTQSLADPPSDVGGWPYRPEHGAFGPRPGAASGSRSRAPLPRRGGPLDR